MTSEGSDARVKARASCAGYTYGMHLGQRHQMMRRKGKVATASPKHIASTLDIAVYIVSFMGMFVTLDQVRLVWFDHQTAGVSFVTWAFYTVSASVWCTYGYIHKDKVLIITNLLWILINGSVALGIAIYGF